MIIRYLHIVTSSITISIFLLLSSPLLFAQKTKTQSAINHLNFGEIDQAKSAIDEAAGNPKSADMSKMWYYKGQIYQSIHESKEEKYNKLDPEALSVAYEAYKKTLELDSIEGEYLSDVVKRLEICGIHFINKGVKAFNEKDYERALLYNEKAIEISQSPKINKTDTLAFYNAALACERINKFDKAEKFYRELIKLNWGGARIYSYAITILKSMDAHEEAFKLIKEGKEKYPDDNNLLIEELNYYIHTGNHSEAEKNLKIAIDKDSTNYNLHWALGSIYDQLGDFLNGEKAYSKALALVEPVFNQKYNDYKASIGTPLEEEKKKEQQAVKTEYFNVVYNFGALYFNEGIKNLKQIATIKDNLKYASEKKESESTMVRALPYLEKALELEPNDRNTLVSLKELYARVGDTVKWQIIKDRLEN